MARITGTRNAVVATLLDRTLEAFASWTQSQGWTEAQRELGVRVLRAYFGLRDERDRKSTIRQLETQLAEARRGQNAVRNVRWAFTRATVRREWPMNIDSLPGQRAGWFSDLFDHVVDLYGDQRVEQVPVRVAELIEAPTPAPAGESALDIIRRNSRPTVTATPAPVPVQPRMPQRTTTVPPRAIHGGVTPAGQAMAAMAAKMAARRKPATV